jgi:hypothetical protein
MGGMIDGGEIADAHCSHLEPLLGFIRVF